MQLFIERPQPEQAPQTKPTRSRGISAPSLRRLAFGLLILAAGNVRPSPSQAAVELYQGPGQSDASMINPCGPLTKISELCFDDRLDADGTPREPEQQGVYRRLLRAGHPEDIDIPFYRAVCPDGAFPGAENPQVCIDQVAQVAVPGATMADLADPERATKFASSLAVPAEQPAEPQPTPSPEPVAAPPAEVGPYSLPTGVIFQQPLNPGQGWLGNVDSCRNDDQHYNAGTYKCIIPETSFPRGTSVIVAFDRENNKPTEAKQGPGDKVTVNLFYRKADGSRIEYGSGYQELFRYSRGAFFWRFPNTLPSNVYEMESGLNGGAPIFIYRFQIKP